MARGLHLLAVGLLAVSAAQGAAWADMVSTEAVLAQAQDAESARSRVASLLARDDVQAQLESLGVDPDDARARVAALTDAEVVALDGRLGELPAGGDFVGAVVGVVIVTIAVLIFTDLLGLTDVFPFIDPLPRGDGTS